MIILMLITLKVCLFNQTQLKLALYQIFFPDHGILKSIISFYYIFENLYVSDVGKKHRTTQVDSILNWVVFRAHTVLSNHREPAESLFSWGGQCVLHYLDVVIASEWSLETPWTARIIRGSICLRHVRGFSSENISSNFLLAQMAKMKLGIGKHYQGKHIVTRLKSSTSWPPARKPGVPREEVSTTQEPWTHTILSQSLSLLQHNSVRPEGDWFDWSFLRYR